MTAKPSVRRCVLNTLREHPDGVAADVLVSVVADEADASERLVRITLGRLEAEGELYAAEDCYKVTDK